MRVRNSVSAEEKTVREKLRTRTVPLHCLCGGDRNRTGVQTRVSKAFYMLISELLVGKQQEQNKPIVSLEE